MDIKDVAKEIRAILKKEFPATKFSVTISRFSMGSSVDTSWTDGPTTDQVDKLIGHYGDSRSRFIETSRTHSRELVTQAIAAWREQNPEYAHFTVTCNGETSCHAEFDLSEFNRGSHCLQDCERSLINEFIYGSAFDGTNLIRLQENADDCEPEVVSDPEPESVEVVAETTSQPQPSHIDPSDADVLEVDRQQAYAQYMASQQEADALEAKLAVKRTEAQVHLAIMKEIDEQIEAKKREAVVIAPTQAQPDFDVKKLEAQKVTLVLINGMGVPVCRHVTVISADIVSAKRYQGDMTSKMCLQLEYVEKGKRKLRGTRYTEADLAVALGWQQIEVPSSFTSFDTGLLDGMVRQAKDVVYTQQSLLK
ncbi:LPD29 domain-containing protein [Microcoleus sp. Pol12B5]|uniref:LPD29 domain-containing protein n=1 Tax=Microcoleus sp. Pol12B5 TaxID=3055396 RepID=UPI002FD2F8D6